MPPHNHTPHAGLLAHYASSSDRSFRTVQSAIKRLQKSGRKVTLSSIVEHSKGGISHTTILRNPRCRALYEEASGSSLSPRGRTRRKLRLADADQREISRAQYLRRKTKEELIKLLIEAERQIKTEREHTASLRDRMLSELVLGNARA